MGKYRIVLLKTPQQEQCMNCTNDRCECRECLGKNKHRFWCYPTECLLYQTDMRCDWKEGNTHWGFEPIDFEGVEYET